MLITFFIYVIMIGLAASAVSFTISITSLFLPIREAVSRLHPKLEELIHCPFCLSMWVVYILAGLSPHLLLEIPFVATNGLFFTIMSFIIAAFSAQAVSGLSHFVLLRAYDPVAKAKMRREMEKMNNSKEVTNHG